MRYIKFRPLMVILVIAGLIAGVVPAQAQDDTSFCMNDAWNNYGGNKGTLNCTAKEVYIAENPDGSKIISAEIVGGDGCRFPGDTATVDILATLHFNADRYDVGVYSSADGGDGYFGQCYVA